jgi:TATA-box binding protein (TBP) (component of TFIID and TFIIIB)
MESFDYILKLANIRDGLLQREDYPEPSWIRITTITMCSSFNEKIDLVKFRESFEKSGTIRTRNLGSKFDGHAWNISEPKKSKNGNFYNCLAIWFKDFYSSKNVKLFPNGSIQVAGCANLFDCWLVLKHVQCIMKTVLGLEKQLEFAQPQIAMINTNFSLNCQVNIKRVIAKFKSDPKFNVSFNPDKYAAVKVKFKPEEGMKQVTASIFSTGKTIVTGAQTLDEIVMAYKTINDVFGDRGLFGDVRASKPETFDTFMGAKFVEWVRVLKEKNRV